MVYFHQYQKKSLYILFSNFRDLKQSDEGFYECQVNASPLLRHRIHLNVVGKFRIDIR